MTVLDLVIISRLQDAQIRITDVDENLDDLGFGSLEIKAQSLVNEDDMEVIRDSLSRARPRRSSCTRRAGSAACQRRAEGRRRKPHCRAGAA